MVVHFFLLTLNMRQLSVPLVPNLGKMTQTPQSDLTPSILTLADPYCQVGHGGSNLWVQNQQVFIKVISNYKKRAQKMSTSGKKLSTFNFSILLAKQNISTD